jgi:membrane protease YdiL (CAAX protease family)
VLPVAEYWIEYAEIAALLLIAVVFRLRKGGHAPLHPFFLQQRWTITEAVACLILSHLAFKLGAFLFDIAPPGWLKFALQLLVHLMPLLVIWAFFGFYLQQSFSAVGMSLNRPSFLIIAGAKWSLWVWVVLLFTLSLMPEVLTPNLINSARITGIESILKRYGAWMGGFYWFFFQFWIVGLAVLTEEVSYRGLLYGALRRQVSYFPATLISSACFMIGHLGFNPILFGFGCLTAYLVEKYHSLIPAIVMHLVWDFAMSLHEWFVGGIHVDPTSYFQISTIVAAVALGTTYVVSYRLKRGIENPQTLGTDSS